MGIEENPKFRRQRQSSLSGIARGIDGSLSIQSSHQRAFPNWDVTFNFGWMNSAQELVGEAQSNLLRLLGTATLTADRDYFLLRASQEMLAAETAGHAAARAAHSQIAEHYLALAASIEAHRRRTRDTPPKHPHKRV